MQCCYAWNHRRQRWHTPSSVLLSFALPSPWRQREKKEKTHLCTRPKLLQHHKLCCCFLLSIAEVFATISSPPQLRWCTQMQQRFSSGALHSVRCSYDKRELHSKMHPAVCSYLFLLTYFFFFFYHKAQPWSNHESAERDQIERRTRMFVAHRPEQFLLHCSGIVWSKEECRNRPDLLFPVWLSVLQRQREKCSS